MSKNRWANLNNVYQTKAKRVLAVCSAGMLRAPTLANVLWKEWAYNTRSCGMTDFALIPIDEELIVWADEIVFVSCDVWLNTPVRIQDTIAEFGKKIVCLSIPDDYEWGDAELMKMCLEQYSEHLKSTEDVEK